MSNLTWENGHTNQPRDQVANLRTRHWAEVGPLDYADGEGESGWWSWTILDEDGTVVATGGTDNETAAKTIVEQIATALELDPLDPHEERRLNEENLEAAFRLNDAGDLRGALHRVLWPPHNPDADWSADTLDIVANLVVSPVANPTVA